MNRVWLVIATGALMALAGNFGIPTASAKERCVCSMEVPPVPPAPPVAPVPPVPPVPPPPPPDGYRVHKQVMLIAPDSRRPDGSRHVHLVRRVVRIVDRDGNHMVRVIDLNDERNLTRKEFVRRAERAFDERDKNHDGVLEDDERGDFASAEDDDNDDEDIEIPEAPEPPEADDVPEPPEAPEPPRPPHHHH